MLSNPTVDLVSNLDGNILQPMVKAYLGWNIIAALSHH